MNIFFWKKNQKPYPRSFAKRLTWRIMLTLFIVMGFTSVMIVFIGWMLTGVAGGALMKFHLDNQANGVEKVLTEVCVATNNAVPYIEDNLQRPDRMQGIMKRIVEQNPHIRSCGLSFVDNYYPQKGHWFCPYAQRCDSNRIEVMKIGSQQENYLKAEWFQEALKAKEGYWAKPFFDGLDHQTPLVSYLMPIRNEQDSTVAVLGVDITLESLAREISLFFYNDRPYVENWSAEEKAYYFIVDSTGTFLVHPNEKYLIRQNLIDMAKKTADVSDDYAVDKIFHDDLGYVYGYDAFNVVKIDNTEVAMAYTSIEHTPWKMGFVIPYSAVNILFYVVAGLFLFFILLGLLVVFFAGRRGIKKTSAPLRQLAISADEVAKGNFDTHLPNIKSRDEIHQLRDSFENMQQSLTRYVNELRDTTAQKASMESELKIAHDIQMSMLPKTFPPYPERDDIDIYGTLTPAKAVGGDLFDFYIRDNQLFFCIGDVSGKGIPASMFMAVARSLFRNISAHVAYPERIAYTLNNALSEGNETNMFVTLFTGVLDLATGHLCYCNAGHNAPLLVGRDVGDCNATLRPGVRELPCLPNLPLGIMGEFQFEAQEVDLDPDTTIFLFTDGLNEAENAFHEQFGDERIVEVANRLLAKHEHQPINITYEMYQAVHNFVNGAEQSDDLTMLAIQYKGLRD